MSNVSNVHDVVPFIAGETKPFTGQRLAKVGYKTTKKQAAKFASIAVSVPHMAVETVQDIRFLPYLGAYLETVQDAVIRSLYETSDGQLTQVTDADIGADAMLAYLTAEAEGTRITADKIKSWFDAEIKDNLTVTICDRIGTDDVEHAQVKQTINAYREVFAALSGKNVFMEQAKVSKLRAAIEVASEPESDITKKLTAKLDALASAKDVSEML